MFSAGNVAILQRLVDHVEATYFPVCEPLVGEARHLAFFSEVRFSFSFNPHRDNHVFFPPSSSLLILQVCRRTATLVAAWQSVGFCHGVLNTDNMSIVGVTIDYGPFGEAWSARGLISGFMERFDPRYICNGSDNNGRYTYEAQVSHALPLFYSRSSCSYHSPPYVAGTC
jgi:uncharacterized protein YdiU (UPF0061 family)